MPVAWTRDLLRGVFVVTLSTYQRLVRPVHLLFAAAIGVGAGALAASMPAASLAIEVFDGAMLVGAALVLLPLVAAVPADDRRGGLEPLQLARPVPSLGWSLGRLLGSLAGAFLLMVVVQLAARVATWNVAVPVPLPGRAVAEGADQWRFPLTAGDEGPFDLTVPTFMPWGGTSELEVLVHRGKAEQTLSWKVRPQHQVVLALPDLSPQRGDLYVTLRPGAGLLLGKDVPTLDVGSESLGAPRSDPAARRAQLGVLLRLALIVITAVSAACAFRFETACLAGLLAAVAPLPAPVAAMTSGALGLPLLALVGVLVLLGVIATLGTALVRRSALP